MLFEDNYTGSIWYCNFYKMEITVNQCTTIFTYRRVLKLHKEFRKMNYYFSTFTSYQARITELNYENILTFRIISDQMIVVT